MATVTVVLYHPVIEYMRGWAGDIGRSTHTLAVNMAVAQRALAPKKTGKLAASITVGPKSHWAKGIMIDVGANPGRGAGRVGYAVWNDQGTLPHIIRPRGPGYSLKFFWGPPKGPGEIVYPWLVHHPGNRAYHWAERGALVGMVGWGGFGWLGLK